jgi:SRSO17 transposase
VAFATKPALAALMITAAVDGELPAPWATVDEVYGADPELRQTPQQRGIGYVPGTGSNRTVTNRRGHRTG